MKKLSWQKRISISFYLLGVIWFCHHFIFRPIFLDWGAPESLRVLNLEGDVFTTGDIHTRAVINAQIDEVWPWIAQIGQDRAGFYSHQWLENLFLADMHNVFSIERRFQQPRQVGDTIWLANKEHYNGAGYQIVAKITPFRSFVMVGGSDYTRIKGGENASGCWALYLQPQSDSTTWLIARSSSGNIRLGEKVLRYLTFEVPHFIMEARMLNTVKRLAEEKS
jgi:hypothetical protein